MPEVAATKKRNGSKAEARASTTDADARVMKMGDGGFRPAYNVQFVTTCEEQVIVGMAVVKWRARMASDEVKEIHKQRASTAECVNAQARNRGLLQMPVRGLAKVR